MGLYTGQPHPLGLWIEVYFFSDINYAIFLFTNNNYIEFTFKVVLEFTGLISTLSCHSCGKKEVEPQSAPQ